MFVHVVVLVIIFLVCLILLVAIRPPFTFAKPKDKELAVKQFSSARAAVGAFIATAVAGIIMLVVALTLNKKPGRASHTVTLAAGTK